MSTRTAGSRGTQVCRQKGKNKQKTQLEPEKETEQKMPRKGGVAIGGTN